MFPYLENDGSIDSGNGLVLLANKSLSAPILANIYVAIQGL